MLTSMASPARRGAVPALAGGLHPSVRFCQKTQETERWRPTIHAGLRPVSAGQQSSRKETAGRMTGYYDLIVAATARYRGSQLATFNRRHFEHIRGLNLVAL